MMGDRQSQKGGDSSTNYQAQRDIVISGPSYSEVEQIAMTVFKANFLELGDKAAERALERAQDFVEAFLKKAAEEGQTKISEAENPDFRYALFSAQKEYARTGDEDLGELLVQLLIDRTKIRSRDLMQIVLNESLTVAPMLTPDQLDTLSLVFLIKRTRSRGLNSLAALHSYLDRLILPFLPGVSSRESAYEHLEYARCGAISIDSVQVEEAFRQHYPGLLCKGFSQEEILIVGLAPEAYPHLIVPCLHDDALLQVNALDDESIDANCAQLGIDSEKAKALKSLQIGKVMEPQEVKEYLTGVRPQMERLFEVCDSTSMKHMTLTSVGIAIAHANIKRQAGEVFDLSIWI